MTVRVQALWRYMARF